MKMLFVLMSFILISCKSTIPLEKGDLLSNLITIHKSGGIKVLVSKFGPPTRIEKTDQIGILKYIYETTPEKESFVAFVDSQKEEVMSTSSVFWKSNDDYELLKKRFGNYKWIEKYVPTSPHPLRELYEVNIPELGMTFEYDKLAPKIMWIFLEKPKQRK